MEKRYDFAGDHQYTSSSSSDQYLKQLNKVSHKISKPIKRNPFDHHHQQQQQHQAAAAPLVFKINKCDFRDVVQRLTGSSSAHHYSTPPPPPPTTIIPHKPQTSRLHSIRPPPLAHVSTTKPSVILPSNNITNPPSSATTTTFNIMNNTKGSGRQVTPLSPLPPFPSVNLAEESPISAYMRYLRSSTSTVEQQQEQQFKIPSPSSCMGQSQFFVPSSPLASTVTTQSGFLQFPSLP